MRESDKAGEAQERAGKIAGKFLMSEVHRDALQRDILGLLKWWDETESEPDEKRPERPVTEDVELRGDVEGGDESNDNDEPFDEDDRR